MRTKASGFSILEMIVVLALIAVILGVFIYRLGGVGDQNRIETARGDLRAIQTAINAYYLNHNNTFPSGTDWLNNDLVNDNPRVLRQIVYDPFRSGNVEYSYVLRVNYYVAFSYGPDKTQDITGIRGDTGELLGQNDDDIYITNGVGFS